MRRRTGSAPTSPGWIRGAKSGIKQALASVTKKDEKQQAEAESLSVYPAAFCEKRSKVAVILGELRRCDKLLQSWVATVEAMRRTAGLMCSESMPDEVQSLGQNLDEDVCSLRALDVFQKTIRLVKEKTGLIQKLLRDLADLDKRLLLREKLRGKVEQSARKLAAKGKSFSTEEVPFSKDFDEAKEIFEIRYKHVCDYLDFIIVESRRGFAYREHVFVRQFCDACFKLDVEAQSKLADSMQRMDSYIEDFWSRQKNFKGERQRERALEKANSTVSFGSDVRGFASSHTDNAPAVAVPSHAGSARSPHAFGYSYSENAPAVVMRFPPRHSRTPSPMLSSPDEASSFYSEGPEPMRGSSNDGDLEAAGLDPRAFPEEPEPCSPPIAEEVDEGEDTQDQREDPETIITKPPARVSFQINEAALDAAESPEQKAGDASSARSAGTAAGESSTSSLLANRRKFNPRPARPWDADNKSSGGGWMGGMTMNLGFPINEKDGWREYVSRSTGESFWVRLEDGHQQDTSPWNEDGSMAKEVSSPTTA